MALDQLPHSVLMVRPSTFGFNTQTASSNTFQTSSISDPKEISKKAIEEFDQMVDLLTAHDVPVIVFEDTPQPVKPDAVFPNNWISFHHDGSVILYPMMAQNRRLERRLEIVEQLKDQFLIKDVWDLSHHENQNEFLEGTGSLVFDHAHKVTYASLSPRTSSRLTEEVSRKLGYKSKIFHSVDEKNVPVYHTNVVMTVGNGFALVCLDSIKSESDQDLLLDSFESSDTKVIAISFAQMNAFAGNMLTVKSKQGEPIQLMSQKAFDSLLPGQINEISKYADVLPLKISTIETHGGGSVRCMVAGIHLPKK